MDGAVDCWWCTPRDATLADDGRTGRQRCSRTWSSGDGMYWGKRLSDNVRLSSGWSRSRPGTECGVRAGCPLARSGCPTTPRRGHATDHRSARRGHLEALHPQPHPAPMTLLHGDPHIGNTYVLPDGEVGFLDWQVLRRGNWSLDLGYFLQGALTTEDRRRHERTLLEQYRDALDLPADELPGMDEIWLRYRASVAHGLCTWLCTASAGELWQRPGYRSSYGATVFDGVRGSADRSGTRRHRLWLSPGQAGMLRRRTPSVRCGASVFRWLAASLRESPPPCSPMITSSLSRAATMTASGRRYPLAARESSRRPWR